MTNKLLAVLKGQGSFAQFARFVLVGGMATLTDLAISLILIYGFSLHENVVTTAAFCIAFFVSYFGHRNFTFKAKGSAVKFFTLSVAMLIVRNGLVAVMVMCGLRGILPILIAMAAVMVLTFVCSKYLVFKA